MAQLPKQEQFDRTLLKIDSAIEQKKALEKQRNYLGMSQIGDECWRKLFYSFRNAEKKEWTEKGIKAIEDGFLQEGVMAFRLRLLPFIELHTNISNTVNNVLGIRIIAPGDDNDQIGFRLLLDHFSGHIDGVIRGIIEAPGTWHIWEHKSVNDIKFNKLQKSRQERGEKQALYEWDIIYYAQAQIYMHCAELTRHYLTVTTPGGRSYISIRTEYNRKYAESIIEKAKSIIFDNWTIPARLSESREYFSCKWCEFQKICHDKNFPQVNCQTCRYSDPVQGGQRKCLLKDKIIDPTILCLDCISHIYNPALIQAELVEHQDDGCLYKISENFYFSNTNLTGMPEIKGRCDAIYTSKELREKIKSINNLTAATSKIEKKFNGKIVESSPIVIKAWNKEGKIDSRLKDI
jgi:hypothetical protein